MSRPHVEFVQSQMLPWTDMRDGVRKKCLSRDAETQASTSMWSVAAGWSSPIPGGSPAMEVFVLDGELQLDGVTFKRHGYLFRPQTASQSSWGSPTGATFIVFRYAPDDPDAQTDPIATDTVSMPWDVSTLDPMLSHLCLARKILRLGPNDSGRTYLLTGLPHGIPDKISMPVERHPHDEEMFLIFGEMKAPEGVMTTGAYFYRPSGIIHGPHISEFGFLMLMRCPGSNSITTEWTKQYRPLPLDPPHDPVLPPGWPSHWGEPRTLDLAY
jgi:hypothetical protein